MPAICLLCIASATYTFHTRNYCRRDGANAGVKEDRATSPRAGLVIISCRCDPVQIAGGRLNARIGRFIRGRRATLRRFLVGRRHSLYLNDRCRRRTRRIEDRAKPKDVTRYRGQTIGGQLCLMVFIEEGRRVVTVAGRLGPRATRHVESGARVIVAGVFSARSIACRYDRASGATRLGRIKRCDVCNAVG